jgi:DNA-binding transcriptional LysR family regulator
VGQSTLSESVRRLEAELGTPLLLRTSAGSQPTEAGRLLLARADALLDLVDQTTREIQDLHREERGRVVLGCHDSLGSYFLPPFIRELAERYPSIELDIRVHASSDVRDRVVAGEIDLGLVVNPQPHPELVMAPAFGDVVQLFGLRAASSLAEVARWLADAVLIVPSRSPFDDVCAAFEALGMVAGRRLPCGDLGVARSLAAAGVGPALLPSRVAASAGLVPVHPDLPHNDDHVVLLWRADLPRTRAITRVRDALRAHARALPPIDRLLDTAVAA